MNRRLMFVVGLLLLLPLSLVTAQGGEVQVGGTVEGALSDSTDTYTLALESGQTVNITLQSDDFDPYLEIQDAAGSLLGEDDDSGGSFNSALLFVAPETGTYNVIVRSYSGSATGAYTLGVETASITELAYGESADVSINNAAERFTFTGTAGDVVNIYTASPADLDVRLSLTDPAGDEIYYDDDNGPGYQAYIRRAVLPADGAYRLVLEPVFGEAVGDVTVTLEAAELPLLDGGPYTAMLGEDLSLERVGFTAEAGQRYRLSISLDKQSSAFVEVSQTGWETYSLSFNGALEASMIFVPTESGVLPIEIDDSSWSDGTTTYEISVEPVME